MFIFLGTPHPWMFTRSDSVPVEQTLFICLVLWLWKDDKKLSKLFIHQVFLFRICKGENKAVFSLKICLIRLPPVTDVKLIPLFPNEAPMYLFCLRVSLCWCGSWCCFVIMAVELSVTVKALGLWRPTLPSHSQGWRCRIRHGACALHHTN